MIFMLFNCTWEDKKRVLGVNNSAIKTNYFIFVTMLETISCRKISSFVGPKFMILSDVTCADIVSLEQKRSHHIKNNSLISNDFYYPRCSSSLPLLGFQLRLNLQKYPGAESKVHWRVFGWFVYLKISVSCCSFFGFRHIHECCCYS